jgi:diacylglycerol kinase family enzyme
MIHVILNPASGTAGQPETAKQVASLFEAAGVVVRVYQVGTPSDIPGAVHQAVDTDSAIQAIVAGGGDGTVNAIASALVGGPIPLGILPLGTLNHFAKDLHIPLDLAQAVETIAHGRSIHVDVGRVNDRMFLNNSSIGIYPNIVERREQLRAEGHRKWPALAIATLEVLRRQGEVSARVEVDGRTIASRTPFVFVGNNEYQVEGIHLGARARLDTGRLFAYLAPRVHTRELPKLFGQALLGRARREQSLQVLAASELWIETPYARSIKVACDGELLLLKTPLHYRSWPGALHVLVPRTAD